MKPLWWCLRRPAGKRVKWLWLYRSSRLALSSSKVGFSTSGSPLWKVSLNYNDQRRTVQPRWVSFAAFDRGFARLSPNLMPLISRRQWLPPRRNKGQLLCDHEARCGSWSHEVEDGTHCGKGNHSDSQWTRHTRSSSSSPQVLLVSAMGKRRLGPMIPWRCCPMGRILLTRPADCFRWRRRRPRSSWSEVLVRGMRPRLDVRVPGRSMHHPRECLRLHRRRDQVLDERRIPRFLVILEGRLTPLKYRFSSDGMRTIGLVIDEVRWSVRFEVILRPGFMNVGRSVWGPFRGVVEDLRSRFLRSLLMGSRSFRSRFRIRLRLLFAVVIVVMVVVMDCLDLPSGGLYRIAVEEHDCPLLLFAWWVAGCLGGLAGELGEDAGGGGVVAVLVEDFAAFRGMPVACLGDLLGVDHHFLRTQNEKCSNLCSYF